MEFDDRGIGIDRANVVDGGAEADSLIDDDCIGSRKVGVVDESLDVLAEAQTDLLPRAVPCSPGPRRRVGGRSGDLASAEDLIPRLVDERLGREAHPFLRMDQSGETLVIGCRERRDRLAGPRLEGALAPRRELPVVEPRRAGGEQQRHQPPADPSPQRFNHPLSAAPGSDREPSLRLPEARPPLPALAPSASCRPRAALRPQWPAAAGCPAPSDARYPARCGR